MSYEKVSPQFIGHSEGHFYGFKKIFLGGVRNGSMGLRSCLKELVERRAVGRIGDACT